MPHEMEPVDPEPRDRLRERGDEDRHPGIIRRRDQLLSPGAERVLDALRSTARRLYTDLEPSPTGTAPP